MADDLERLLRGVAALGHATGLAVVLIGGVARGAWAPVRATRDVDIIVGTTDLAAVTNAAPAAGLVAVPDEVAWLASAEMTRLRLPELPTGPVRVDILAAVHPYYERVIQRARQVTVMGVDLRVACPEDIIILKVLADRPQDRADVRAIIDAQPGIDWELLRAEAEALDLTLPTPG